MPAHDQGVNSFVCAVGGPTQGPSVAAGDTVMNYLGAQLTAAAAAATLTLTDGNGGPVIATIAAPIGQSGADSIPTFVALKSGQIWYTLAGAGSSAFIRWNTG